MTKNRRLVYTSVFGGYDVVQPPQEPDPETSYVCVTDDTEITVPGWQTIQLDPRVFELSGLDHTRLSRFAKILPHRLFSEFSESLYIDANLTLTGPSGPLFDELSTSDAIFFRHPDHRADIYAEAEACIAFGKDDPSRINDYIERCRGSNFPGKANTASNTIPAGMAILRRHNADPIRRTMELWWSEYMTGSRRDQLSLSFALWSLGTPHRLLDFDVRKNEYFHWRRHDSVTSSLARRALYASADAVVLHAPGLEMDWIAGAISEARASESGYAAAFRRLLSLGSLRKRELNLIFDSNSLDPNARRTGPFELQDVDLLRGKPIAFLRQGDGSLSDRRAREYETAVVAFLAKHDAAAQILDTEALARGEVGALGRWLKNARFPIDYQTLRRAFVMAAAKAI